MSILKGKKGPVFRVLLYIVIGYTVLVVLAFLLQRRMLYFPDRDTPSDRWIRGDHRNSLLLNATPE